jgi:hypothetical protein
MVRFLAVEQTYLDSNLRFDVIVAYLRLIILLVDNDMLFDRLRKS